MADYLTIAVIHILVGFEVLTLGFLNHVNPAGRDEETIEALMIIAFLVYLLGVILTVLIKSGDLAGNKIAMITTIILVFVAAACMCAGAAIWADHNGSSGNNTTDPYKLTLDFTGAILAAIGGIFLIVAMVSGGGGSV